jgi:hypothetical protein
VAALPQDAYVRVIAGPVLVSFQHMLGQDPSQPSGPDEQDFLMKMYDYWDQAHDEGRDEGRTEGRTQGRTEGQVEARARDVITVLRVRGVAMPDAVRDRILAETDLERPLRWLERAAVATSIGHVLDEDPS